MAKELAAACLRTPLHDCLRPLIGRKVGGWVLGSRPEAFLFEARTMRKPIISILTASGMVPAATETDASASGHVRIVLIDIDRRLMGTSAIVISPDDAIRLATDMLNAARDARACAEVNAMVREAFKS